MARIVKGISPGVEREYVPESFDNRSDPDPIRVWIRTPTEDDRRTVMASVDWSPKEDAAIRLRDAFVWQKLAVQRHVTRVAGYTVRGIVIDTGEKLAQYGETQLLIELASEIVSEFSLREEEKKLSERPSDSTSSETNRLNGAAPNVSAEDSMSSAVAA